MTITPRGAWKRWNYFLPLVAVAACGGGADGAAGNTSSSADGGNVAAPEGGSPQLDVSAPSHDFGAVHVGDESAPVSFTVKNDGAVSASAVSAAMTGSGAGSFDVADKCGGRDLAPGDSCTVTVAFKPVAASAMSASLAIQSAGRPAASIALTGAGSATTVSLTPTAYDFPPTAIGSTSDAMSFVVVSTLTSADTTGKLMVRVQGTDAKAFAIADDKCSGTSLGPQQSCYLHLTFTPGTLGAKSAALAVTTASGTVTSTLSGLGVTPASLQLSPGSYDFGAVTTGSSVTQSFTIENTGALTSGFPSPSITGPSASELVIAGSTCNARLAPNQTCTVTVQLTPASPGPKSATLEVAASPGGTPQATLTATAL